MTWMDGDPCTSCGSTLTWTDDDGYARCEACGRSDGDE